MVTEVMVATMILATEEVTVVSVEATEATVGATVATVVSVEATEAMVATSNRLIKLSKELAGLKCLKGMAMVTEATTAMEVTTDTVAIMVMEVITATEVIMVMEAMEVITKVP